MRKAARTLCLSVSAGLGATAIGMPAVGSPVGSTSPEHTVVAPSANPDAAHGLADVGVLSADDIWAVGSREDGGSASLTWVRHSDGHRWTHVPSPSPGTLQNSLRSVSTVSASDVWAAGAQVDVGDSDERPLVEHWDGASWTVVAQPPVEGRAYGVSASAPDDAWLVGDFIGTPRAEHWDGSAWTDEPLEIPDVKPPYQVTLMLTYDVETLSARNAWLIGIYDAQSGDGGYERELLSEHWDGTSWHFVALPHQTDWSYPFDITASSPKDVWAVGTTDLGYEERPLVAHWDGHNWTTTTQNTEGVRRTWLTGVSPVAPNDVWAVGFQDAHQRRPYAEHWDGRRWTVDGSVDPGSASSSLSGVDVAASDDVLAVGGLGTRKKGRGLTEHWDGTSWSRQR